MSVHPELGWRLAQAKIEEARSGTRRASTLRALSLDRRAPDLTVSTRWERWAAPIPALVTRSRAPAEPARKRPRTMKG